MTISSRQDAPAQAESGRRLQGWALTAVLASLLLANFLSGLDQVIVETAIPRIIGDLQGFDRYTWVITAYLLCSTAMVPIAGKLSDQFGRKWLLMGAIALFLLSSALAGASQTMNQLIIFRGLQGLSAGAIQTLVSTIVADIFSPAERPRWQGLFVGVFALASVIGPTAGGWITDHPGWRWVFYQGPRNPPAFTYGILQRGERHDRMSMERPPGLAILVSRNRRPFPAFWDAA